MIDLNWEPYQKRLEERYKGMKFIPTEIFIFSFEANQLELFKIVKLPRYVSQGIISQEQSQLLYESEKARLEEYHGLDVEDFHKFDPDKADMKRYLV
jgi:hypothetical protein